MKTLISIAICLTLFACKKDSETEDATVTGDCFDFQFDDCHFGIEWRSVLPIYLSPCYNPNNANEFVYLYNNNLWKHNLATGQSVRVETPVRPITHPDWSRSGWITFAGIDWNIWIVREDGSESKQISHTPRDLYSQFDPDGERIIYARNMEYSHHDLQNEPNLRLDYKMMLIDLDGTPLDSFCRGFDYDPCYPWKFSSWSGNDLLAAEFGPDNDGNDYGLAIYDLHGDEQIRLYKYEGNADEDADFLNDINWHPDNQRVFFTDGHGLHVADMLSGQMTTLIEGCQSRYYEDFSISPDGNSIIACRVTAEYANCVVQSEYDLVQMDIDGTNEIIIELNPPS